MQDEMISLEEALDIVLGNVAPTPVEAVDLLDVVGRVSAGELVSDMDVSPFAHSAMDGYAIRAAVLADADAASPVQLKVIAEIGAGDVFDGNAADDECVRIMTGAELPACFDSVVKYEIVDVVEGDGKPGSIVSFSAPTDLGSNVRQAGEEARAGEVIVGAGEVISCAGVGYLASCGILDVVTYKRPRVAVMATGSELVPPDQKPGRGHIRESNSYAIAACINAAGAEAARLPIVEDTFEALRDAVDKASREYDFVITTGGAANGDFDFIKPVVNELGELLMTTVNIRPGKAQTFGIVNGTPVFGLPGNPAAAYCGFELIIRPALRKMMGYSHFEHPHVWAKIACNQKKKDPRRIYLRATLTKNPETGDYICEPAKKQSSGLFGVIQKSNCLAVMPEGLESKKAGDLIECVLLDVTEEVEL